MGGDGLLYRYLRYEDGLPPGEGAFGIASFWMVDCRCRQGLVEEGQEIFEHLCGLSNDVGLYAEEIDPASGELLGNFPQAYTHAGLIDAALTLEAAWGGTAARSAVVAPEARARARAAGRGEAAP